VLDHLENISYLSELIIFHPEPYVLRTQIFWLDFPALLVTLPLGHFLFQHHPPELNACTHPPFQYDAEKDLACMETQSNCSVVFTLFKVTFLGKWDECGERPFLWPLTSFPDRHDLTN